MDILPLYISAILGSVTSSAKIAVQGTEGRSVLISWSYDASYKDNAKYFCRGNYLPVTLKKLIESNANKNDQNVTNDKYSLYDNKSAALLIVTISKLTQDDNGIYHCGIDKFSFDTYVLVQVSVTEARTTDSPLNTSTIHTDSKRQPHTTSTLVQTADSPLSTSAINTDSKRQPHTTSTLDVISPSMNMSKSSQTPTDMMLNKNGKADIPSNVIAVSAFALVFVLLLIIGIYYAKMKKTKLVRSTGGRTKTIKNTCNGAAQVSEQNIDMVPYSDISFAEINNPIYANSAEDASYSTDKCHKKEQRPSITYATVKCDKEEHRPSITYATVKCDKEEHRPSITYTAVDFVDCEKKPNVLASTSEDPSLYSTVNC